MRCCVQFASLGRGAQCCSVHLVPRVLQPGAAMRRCCCAGVSLAVDVSALFGCRAAISILEHSRSGIGAKLQLFGRARRWLRIAQGAVANVLRFGAWCIRASWRCVGFRARISLLGAATRCHCKSRLGIADLAEQIGAKTQISTLLCTDPAAILVAAWSCANFELSHFVCVWESVRMLRVPTRLHLLRFTPRHVGSNWTSGR